MSQDSIRAEGGLREDPLGVGESEGVARPSRNRQPT